MIFDKPLPADQVSSRKDGHDLPDRPTGRRYGGDKDWDNLPTLSLSSPSSELGAHDI